MRDLTRRDLDPPPFKFYDPDPPVNSDTLFITTKTKSRPNKKNVFTQNWGVFSAKIQVKTKLKKGLYPKLGLCFCQNSGDNQKKSLHPKLGQTWGHFSTKIQVRAKSADFVPKLFMGAGPNSDPDPDSHLFLKRDPHPKNTCVFGSAPRSIATFHTNFIQN